MQRDLFWEIEGTGTFLEVKFICSFKTSSCEILNSFPQIYHKTILEEKIYCTFRFVTEGTVWDALHALPCP